MPHGSHGCENCILQVRPPVPGGQEAAMGQCPLGRHWTRPLWPDLKGRYHAHTPNPTPSGSWEKQATHWTLFC